MDNVLRPPKRNYFLQALLRQQEQPECKPDPRPEWAKILLSRGAPVCTTPSVEESRKLAVWSCGTPIDGHDPTVMRRDCYGSMMLFSQYGNCSSEYGWEIDHIVPVAANGSSFLSNLQPLHWKNNKLEGRPRLPILR